VGEESASGVVGVDACTLASKLPQVYLTSKAAALAFLALLLAFLFFLPMRLVVSNVAVALSTKSVVNLISLARQPTGATLI
jgi:hypothetical protein